MPILLAGIPSALMGLCSGIAIPVVAGNAAADLIHRGLEKYSQGDFTGAIADRFAECPWQSGSEGYFRV